MNEPFELPDIHKRKELLLPAQLLQYSYTHKFRVQVNGLEALFEPDEERAYRGVVGSEQVESSKIEIELLQAIAEALRKCRIHQ